jgi:hypothetical protein
LSQDREKCHPTTFAFRKTYALRGELRHSKPALPGTSAWLVGESNYRRATAKVRNVALASDTTRWCPCHLRLGSPLMMPMMTRKTNVRPVDGPAVTDRDKHQADNENDITQKWAVLA